MKRVLGILVGASLALVIGCAESYDLRLDQTIQNLKYRQDLNKNTEKAPAKSNLETAKVYIRPPKGLIGPAQTFAFVIEQGKFDAADSFIDQEKQASLHILARSNAPKQATPKKGPNPTEGMEPAAPTAVRGDFTTDVLDFIKGAYSTDIVASQLKSAPIQAHGGRKGLTYKSATLDLANKEVKVYFYGDKSGPQAALIFEGPKDSLKGLASQIDYSLNSLVLGPRATTLYNGGDELAEEAAAAPPGGVF